MYISTLPKADSEQKKETKSRWNEIREKENQRKKFVKHEIVWNLDSQTQHIGPKRVLIWRICELPPSLSQQKRRNITKGEKGAKGQKQNNYMKERMGPNTLMIFHFSSLWIYIFWLGIGPTSATIVFMDWMIKRATHVDSEPKATVQPTIKRTHPDALFTA